MSKITQINKENFKIARKNAGFSTVEASKKVTTSKKNLVEEWEKGGSTPTWKQAETLSRIYNVPLVLMMSNKSLSVQREIPDFRSNIKEMSLPLKRYINDLLKTQKWLENKIQQADGLQNSIQGIASATDSVDELSKIIADKLQLELEYFYSIGSAKNKLLYLIERLEDKDVFVGKTFAHYDIPVKEMRGMFISNKYAPMIILNRKDAYTAQLFTLVHEITHLFRNTEGVSNIELARKETLKEERLCNEVAAKILMPESFLPKSKVDLNQLKQLANKLTVSPIAMFYRLKNSNRIAGEVDKVLEKVKLETKQNLEAKEAKGSTGGNYYNNTKDSNGTLLNRFVSSLYFNQEINFVEASNILRLAVNKV
jgi:Zn-dependent peptidase ImmA (M78 family)/transcriptional regulator with XRE-family HTH domain